MSNKTPWWKSQFADPTITAIMFGWRTDTKAEVDQIIKQTRLRPGAEILDLACGQGRHAIELARRGFKVTGLDYSPLLLAAAKRAAKKLPKNKQPVFVRGDMRGLKKFFSAGQFDAVVNLWNAWGYFDRRSDDQKTMAGIAHVLKPGGLVVINTLNEGGVIERLEGNTSRWHEEKGGRYFLQKSAYDSSAQKLHAEWTLVSPRQKSVKHYKFSQNVYSTRDFQELLRQEGLQMTELWGLLEGTEYAENSWHQTFVAQKND